MDMSKYHYLLGQMEILQWIERSPVEVAQYLEQLNQAAKEQV